MSKLSQLYFAWCNMHTYVGTHSTFCPSWKAVSRVQGQTHILTHRVIEMPCVSFLSAAMHTEWVDNLELEDLLQCQPAFPWGHPCLLICGCDQKSITICSLDRGFWGRLFWTPCLLPFHFGSALNVSWHDAGLLTHSWLPAWCMLGMLCHRDYCVTIMGSIRTQGGHSVLSSPKCIHVDAGLDFQKR